jgi:tripartite-type tricarboxylate transporter receptor subunit TctC
VNSLKFQRADCGFSPELRQRLTDALKAAVNSAKFIEKMRGNFVNAIT